MIDNIYSSAYVGQSGSLMNRALQSSIVNGHKFNATLEYYNDWKFKKNQDGFSYSFTGTYNEEKTDNFKDYAINYGSDATPAYKSNEYYKNKPNKSFLFKAHIGYMYWLNDDDYIQPEYMFTHNTRDKDSQRFLLDRLEEEGVFGTLPDGYLSAIDNDNSFTSRYNDNTHILSARINHWSKRFSFVLTPQVHIFDQSLDCNRGGKDYTVSRNRTSFALASWTEMSYTLAFKNDEFGNARSAQTLKQEYLITPRTPDLLYLVPIQDAVDPLNIHEGAESLRNELLHETNLSWIYKPSGSRLNNVLLLGYQINQNMLTRGYCYDSQTGVRTIRSYNTNGNWSRFINNTLSLQFGSKGQFSLSSVSRAEQSHMSDMIGIDTAEPARSTVKNWFLTENIKLDWQLGKQKLGLRADVIWRDTRSTRDSFTPFQATTLNYGVSGVFRLPSNFRLSTDLTCYTRSGYADEALNTTDVVWNARLSYTAFKNRWVFMLDGFDILHQLSNVTYGVTAQARTVTYTNVLLTTIPLPDDFEMSAKGTAMNFVFTKARLHRNAELEQSLPWFFNFANSVGWFIEILSPSLLVCMDGCQSEYRLAAAFCKEKGIPSVCLQFGWPSYLHTGFRDLPYTHFLTWGEGFNSLWAKRNRSTAFHAAGYMCNADRRGKHDAITFFLQAPVFLNTEEYLQRMCALAAATAKSYPGVTVMAREHPEHKGKTDLSSLFAPFGNVVIASDDRIEEVYAGTKAVVSHFSSVPMECLAYGCTPIVFDPTPGSRYSPDVEALGLGLVSKSEEEFFRKLPCCLELPPPHGLRQWFEAVGEDAAANIAGFVSSLSR